jgi:hypothetical protein
MCTSQTLTADETSGGEPLSAKEKKVLGGIIAELIDRADSPELGNLCEACGIGAHGGCGQKRTNGRGNMQCCCGRKEWPKGK